MNWHLPVVLLGLASALLAQQSGNATPAEPAAKPAPSQVEQRANTMREHIVTGRRLQSHVRVAVRLKNGNKLLGVVKDGKLVERVDGLRFVEASALDRGAGIRLWYTGGTRNYVFVPFGDFAEYEVLQQLSAKQIEQIESEMQMNERRAAERAAAAARAAGEPAATPVAEGEPPAAGEPPAPAAPATAPAPTKTKKVSKVDKAKAAEEAAAAAAAVKAAQDEQKTMFALVQEFPPAAGWNLQKRDEIARRLVVVGAKPSPTEQRFVDNFTLWTRACAQFGVTAENKPADGEPVPTPADERKSRRQK